MYVYTHTLLYINIYTYMLEMLTVEDLKSIDIRSKFIQSQLKK